MKVLYQNVYDPTTVTCPPPTKIIAVHINYRSRAEQRGRTPAFPSYFMKPVSSVARSGDPVVRPRDTTLLGVEGEIAAIIGRRARSVSPHAGADHVGWYAPANDIGLFDMRWADRGSNLLAKGQDGFTPVGTPVAAEQVNGVPLTIRTRINGAVVQEDSTENMLFPIGLLVADLSRFMTLEPGDVILTGTPAGSGVVEPGDEVEVELVGFGSVANQIVEGTVPLGDFGAQPKVTPDARAAALGLSERRPLTLSPDATAALRSVSTATLSVVLARHGISNPVIAGLRPTRPGTRLLGSAYTLRYVPLREDVRDGDLAPLNAQKQAVESIGPDEVLVIDARQQDGAGTIGDILAARALARGATGIVTDGALRDVAAVSRLEIPTYYRAAHPAVLGRLHYPLETNVPIGCGGALVMPGDVIVGDDDGVLVVPAALAEQAAAEAVEQESREAWALERVTAGESVRGVYPISSERVAEYEAWRDGDER